MIFLQSEVLDLQVSSRSAVRSSRYGVDIDDQTLGAVATTPIRCTV